MQCRTDRNRGENCGQTDKFDLQMIRGTAPKVVILAFGSNELCGRIVDPRAS